MIIDCNHEDKNKGFSKHENEALNHLLIELYNIHIQFNHYQNTFQIEWKILALYSMCCLKRLLHLKMSSITNNKKKINYEDVNLVSKDGDSIYDLLIGQVRGGRIYVSKDKIRDIVKEELDKRLGPYKK